MKIIYLMITALILSSVAFGQLQAVNKHVENPKLRTKSEALTRTVSCGVDTLQYTMSKATSSQLISVNNVTSGYAMGQYFDAPQSMDIHGIDFYGYKADDVNGVTMSVTVNLYNASSSDSLPSGGLIASTTVTVDTSFGGGSLDTLRKTAVFSTPVTVTSSYLVVVENNTATDMVVVTNDYNVGDGNQEWLGVVNIGGLWYRSYNINVGGIAYDADFLFEPHVSTDITAGFISNAGCLPNARSVNFFNTSSPVVENKMFSMNAASGNAHLNFTYDYGDGTPTENAVDANHPYAAAGPYDVTLTDTLFGWTRDCFTDTMVTIGGLNPDFSAVDNNSQIDFTDMSTTLSSVTDWVWNFGDGNTSTQQNPSHTYVAAGNYNVCLTVTAECGDATICDSVTVTCIDPVSGFEAVDNGADVAFTDTSTSYSGVNSWLWDFGDGNTSTQQNPTHTYIDGGEYTVCLTVTDSCSTDSTCQTVEAVGTAGLTESEMAHIKVYPNPMKDALNFTFESIPSQVKFISITGQEVGVISPSGKTAKLNVSEWAQGVYFAQFEFEDGSTVTKKLIKK